MRDASEALIRMWAAGTPINDELARVPLGWMANEAIALGVPIAPFSPDEVTATPNLVQHDSLSVIEKARRLIGIKPERKTYNQP